MILRHAARPIMMFITFAFSLFFMFYSTKEIWWYPFSDTTHNAEAWIYFLSESLIRVILAYIIWELESVFRWSATTFLWLNVADTVDYVLTCNEKWVQSWPNWATLNTFSVAIFGLVFVPELIIRFKQYASSANR